MSRPTPGLGRRCALGLLASLALLAGASLVPAPAAEGATTPTVLTPTPYMGWDTYLAFGPRYSESTVLSQASTLLSSGLQRLGYRYVWLDVGWWQGRRDAHGRIVVSHSQWPHGMAWLTQTLHSAGFLVGLYTDAGSAGCGGLHQGSYGHYRQDADTFGAWGFDAVKVDFCGGVRRQLDPKAAYAAFHRALQSNSSRRPMLLSICNFLEPGQFQGQPAYAQSAFSSYTFGPSTGNSWRTDTDVGSPGNVTFGTVLRNMDADAAHPEAAGPGHWNDPDYLGPDQGLTPGQFQAQLTMWALLAAPLMVSDDLETASPATLAALSNRELVAVDQDPGGAQGTLLSTDGEGQVWVKPLSDGSKAIALLNRGSTPLTIGTTAEAAGLPPSSSYKVRDVWAQTTKPSAGPIAMTVPGQTAELLRVSVAAATASKIAHAR
jgi:alpha-galactosidase